MLASSIGKSVALSDCAERVDFSVEAFAVSLTEALSLPGIYAFTKTESVKLKVYNVYILFFLNPPELPELPR